MVHFPANSKPNLTVTTGPGFATLVWVNAKDNSGACSIHSASISVYRVSTETTTIIHISDEDANGTRVSPTPGSQSSGEYRYVLATNELNDTLIFGYNQYVHTDHNIKSDPVSKAVVVAMVAPNITSIASSHLHFIALVDPPTELGSGDNLITTLSFTVTNLEEGEYSVVTTNKPLLAAGAGNDYTITGLTPGEHYSVFANWVTAAGSVSTESTAFVLIAEMSGVVLEPEAPQPDKVVLNWGNAATYDVNAPLIHEIWSKEESAAESAWSLLATITVAPSDHLTAITSFTHTLPTAGVVYVYKGRTSQDTGTPENWTSYSPLVYSMSFTALEFDATSLTVTSVFGGTKVGWVPSNTPTLTSSRYTITKTTVAGVIETGDAGSLSESLLITNKEAGTITVAAEQILTAEQALCFAASAKSDATHLLVVEISVDQIAAPADFVARSMGDNTIRVTVPTVASTTLKIRHNDLAYGIITPSIAWTQDPGESTAYITFSGVDSLVRKEIVVTRTDDATGVEGPPSNLLAAISFTYPSYSISANDLTYTPSYTGLTISYASATVNAGSKYRFTPSLYSTGSQQSEPVGVPLVSDTYSVTLTDAVDSIALDVFAVFDPNTNLTGMTNANGAALKYQESIGGEPNVSLHSVGSLSIPILGPVNAFTGTNGDPNGIQLSFSPVQDATSYTILDSVTGPIDPANYINNSTLTPKIASTNGTIRHLRVYAAGAAGVKGVPSAVASLVAYGSQTISVPNFTSTPSGAVLNWSTTLLADTGLLNPNGGGVYTGLKFHIAWTKTVGTTTTSHNTTIAAISGQAQSHTLAFNLGDVINVTVQVREDIPPLLLPITGSTVTFKPGNNLVFNNVYASVAPLINSVNLVNGAYTINVHFGNVPSTSLIEMHMIIVDANAGTTAVHAVPISTLQKQDNNEDQYITYGAPDLNFVPPAGTPSVTVLNTPAGSAIKLLNFSV